MLRPFSVFCLTLALSSTLSAAKIQGLIIDWKCAQRMVRDGQAKTFKNDRSCSLMREGFQRPEYGLITDSKDTYRLDDPGNQRILQLLQNTPDKDNLKVVVTGDIDGDSIKVSNISML